MGEFREKLITYLLIIVVLLISLFAPANSAAAKDENSKVVKVGLINWSGFGNEKDGELFRKYSFEYFERLKKATGMNFEYHNYTWDEALKLLEEKKIDTVLGVAYTENRASKYAFINPSVFKKNIDILALKKASYDRSTGEKTNTVVNGLYNKANLTEHNKLIIKGKVFGIVGNFGHKYERLLEKRAGGNNKVIVERFYSNNSLKEALVKGDIDYIIAASYIFPDEDIEKITTLTQDEFYLVANSNKESLINNFIHGIFKIQKDKKKFNQKLIDKYVQKVEQELVLNPSEAKLLNSLDKLTFYVLNGNDLYYKVEDDGTVSGSYSKYIAKLANVLQKKYEIIPITVEEIKKLEKAGFYVDVIRNYKVANAVFGSKMLSEPILERQVLFYENKLSVKETGEKVYVSYYPSLVKKFTKPGDKVIRVKDDKESLRILTENKADIAIVDYSMECYINSMRKYKNIKLVGSESDIPISILVVNTNNQDYLSVINKAIELVPEKYLKLAISKESEKYIYRPTVWEKIKKNIEFFVGVLLIILIIGFIIIRILIKKNKMIKTLTKDTNENNSVKDEFLSRISHDMRTPLNAIISYSDFGIEEKKNPKDVEYFQKIKDNSYNLLNLMKDVLELQRMESINSKGEGTIEVIHLATGVSEIKTEIGALVGKKKIDFTVEVKFNTKNAIAIKYVKVNKKLVRQVIFNVLANAVKYTPSGGKIHLGVEIIEEGNKVIAKHVISDTGIGMSEAVQKNMYESFTVGDKDLTNNDNGTGLGLTIAHKAIRLLDGNIKCKSEVGRGTSFTITFPLEIPTREEIKEYEAENTKLNPTKVLENFDFNLNEKENEFDGKINSSELQKLEGKRALICEDAKINAKIIEKILTKYKMQVDWAENGGKGLELAKKQGYDLIIMDVRMPIMDGFCATREIRKAEIETVILGLSGSNDESDIKKALAIGMNDYLEKPINKHKLLEKILQYVV